MPQVDANTPREEYTISGQSFKVFQPYSEGHVITSGEASALNQTFAENIRNNFAGRVKELIETNAFDADTAQLELDDYMSEYEFGVRRGGGRIGDPVMREALLIAKDKVRQALRKRPDINLKDVAAAEITRLAKEAIESGKYPQILETARARVAAQEDIDDIELGGPVAETPVEAAPAKTRKAAADAA